MGCGRTGLSGFVLVEVGRENGPIIFREFY